MATSGALFRPKPARFTLSRRHGRDRNGAAAVGPPATPGGVLWALPLWEGVGGRAMATSGQLHSGFFQNNAAWGVGELGVCAQFTGTITDRIDAFNSNNSLRFQKALPLTIEAIVEKFAATGTSRSIIFCNNGVNSQYSGISVGVNNIDVMVATMGDATGGTTTDRRTIPGTTTLANNQLYHLIWSVDTNTTARFYINGFPETLGALSGSGGAMAYNSTGPAAVGGGGMPSADGFNGRIYMVNFLNRPIYDAEAKARAADPWRAIYEADRY